MQKSNKTVTGEGNAPRVSKFKTAIRQAYADKQGLIVAANRAYRAAASEGNTEAGETFRVALIRLLKKVGYLPQGWLVRLF